MGKRKKVASVMFTGAVATATAGVGATPAAAQASNWTIIPGGNFTGANDTPATLVFDTALFGTFSWQCPAGVVDTNGALVTQASGASPQLGTILSARFGTSISPCNFSGFGLVMTLDSPIRLDATGNPSAGVTPLALRPNINATIRGVFCRLHVTGSTVPGSYDSKPGNSTQPGILGVNPTVSRTLFVDSVNGCSVAVGVPLFTIGDTFGFQADIAVYPKQAITHS
jgi:hypothetical protein